MLMMRGAGGKTHSDVVYRLTEAVKDRGARGEEEKMKNNRSEIQTHNSNQEILDLKEIKSLRAPRMPLHISVDGKTSAAAEGHQVVVDKKY